MKRFIEVEIKTKKGKYHIEMYETEATCTDMSTGEVIYRGEDFNELIEKIREYG